MVQARVDRGWNERSSALFRPQVLAISCPRVVSRRVEADAFRYCRISGELRVELAEIGLPIRPQAEDLKPESVFRGTMLAPPNSRSAMRPLDLNARMGVQLSPNHVEARSGQLMSVLFTLADAAFLMLVGLASNFAMHLVHALEWNMTVTFVAGMAAAMVVQMVLTVLAAPALGSIEAMVPSMVVGMLSPMQICALELIGYHPTPIAAGFAGAASGLAIFILLRCWNRRRSRSLRRTFPGNMRIP